MATAADVLDFARETMRGFDTRFLPGDGELLRRLLRLEERTIEKLVRLDNMTLELPGDAQDTVDVSTYAASYDLDATFWRNRQATAQFSSGPDLPVRVVPPNHRGFVPETTPAAYIIGSKFYLMDGGAAARVWGWSGVQSVVWDFVTAPAAHASDASTLNAPDEAVEYLAHELAVFMATRGKVAEATLREIKERRGEAWDDLVANAKGQPGADTYAEGT